MGEVACLARARRVLYSSRGLRCKLPLVESGVDRDDLLHQRKRTMSHTEQMDSASDRNSGVRAIIQAHRLDGDTCRERGGDVRQDK